MISLRLEGADKLAKALRAMPDRASRSVQRDALRAGGELIRERAAALAPREPGTPDLADNIRIGNAQSDNGDVAIAIGPTRNFFYGLFQEEGTSRHRAQPFMRPAWDAEGPKALKVISATLWDAIIRRGGGSGRSSGGGAGLL